MSRKYSRRDVLKLAGPALLLGTAALPSCVRGRNRSSGAPAGAVTGEEAGAKVGEKVLAEGGNAVDAAVAAALTSCVATPARSGIGGYGGHMTLALEGGKRISSIDFNTMAPAAARPDMYPLDEDGQVKGRVNLHGWLSVAVPGTLAGLQFALERYGTRSFRELVQPAIEVARRGFRVSETFARAVRGLAGRFRNDPGSAKLYLKNGEPPLPGELLRNPDLADLLSILAERNSVDSFYRGDIAQRIAEGFQKNGGLVTAQDLAAYHAREVRPLQLKWDDYDLFTAPLTAGGLSVLEALQVFKAAGSQVKAPSPEFSHAQLESERMTWKDRLELLGDPEKGDVPVHRLLSTEHAGELAELVRQAVKEKKPVPLTIQKHLDEGTNNLSCADRHGNLVAVTLTQGGSFGAQVTLDGLGLTLGHGMSRFDPHPGHPNAPAPGKRPLHNMCPSVLLRHGQPMMAIGAAGGVRIPSALFHIFIQLLVRGASMEEAIAAPRQHCAGTLDVLVENGWPKANADYLAAMGYKFRTGECAHVSAVSVDGRTGECRKVMR